jgi:hypothetical protein
MLFPIMSNEDIGATPDLSLRLIVATLVRVVSIHPDRHL